MVAECHHRNLRGLENGVPVHLKLPLHLRHCRTEDGKTVHISAKRSRSQGHPLAPVIHCPLPFTCLRLGRFLAPWLLGSLGLLGLELEEGELSDWRSLTAPGGSPSLRQPVDHLRSVGSGHLSGRIQQEQTSRGTRGFWLMTEFPVVVRRGSAPRGTEPSKRYSGKGSDICVISCNESTPLC